MLELWPGNDGTAVHCCRGTRAISDLFEAVSFPSHVLDESAADNLAFWVDLMCGVGVASDDGGLVKMMLWTIPTRGFKQTKQAATTPRHVCAWLQMLAPGSLSVEAC